MKKMTEKNEKILKVIHLLFMSVWTTTLFVMFIIGILLPNATTDEAFYFGHYINYVIDFMITTPAALMTFLTGLVYGVFTKWSVPKSKWLKYKVIITILLIVLGTFWLGPLLSDITEEAKQRGLSLLSDSTYLKNSKITTWACLVNGLLLVFAYFLSTFKPGNQEK